MISFPDGFLWGDELTEGPRTRLALYAYSYLHLPMIAGIVPFAFGLEPASTTSTTRAGMFVGFVEPWQSGDEPWH